MLPLQDKIESSNICGFRFLTYGDDIDKYLDFEEVPRKRTSKEAKSVSIFIDTLTHP